jgi:hypothetical protein
LKNAHLSRCAASLVNRNTFTYASFPPRPPQGGLLRALHLDIFEQPIQNRVFQQAASSGKYAIQYKIDPLDCGQRKPSPLNEGKVA